MAGVDCEIAREFREAFWNVSSAGWQINARGFSSSRETLVMWHKVHIDLVPFRVASLGIVRMLRQTGFCHLLHYILISNAQIQHCAYSPHCVVITRRLT
jgi:hypothetical protein